MPAAPRQEKVDAFCRLVRCQVGSRQVEALARRRTGEDAQRIALQQAVMATAWSHAMPGEPAAEWMRIVQPVEPPMEDVEPDRPLVVLVAGLRRGLAEAARAGDEDAKERVAALRDAFGEPSRDEIVRLLTAVYAEE